MKMSEELRVALIISGCILFAGIGGFLKGVSFQKERSDAFQYQRHCESMVTFEFSSISMGVNCDEWKKQ